LCPSARPIRPLAVLTFLSRNEHQPGRTSGGEARVIDTGPTKAQTDFGCPDSPPLASAGAAPPHARRSHDPSAFSRCSVVSSRRSRSQPGWGNWSPYALSHSFVSLCSDQGVKLENLADVSATPPLAPRTSTTAIRCVMRSASKRPRRWTPSSPESTSKSGSASPVGLLLAYQAVQDAPDSLG
jgi:hypothetical protein